MRLVLWWSFIDTGELTMNRKEAEWQSKALVTVKAERGKEDCEPGEEQSPGSPA